MHQSIKLVAMDIDGTLLGKTKALSTYTQNILTEAGKAGIHLVIASGRALQAIPEMLLNIEGMAYVITSNGSSIFRLSDKKRVYGKDLETYQIDRLLELYEQWGCPMEVFIEGKAYASEEYYEHPEAYGASETGSEYVRTTRKPVKNLREFVKENTDCIEGINYIVKNPKEKERMRQLLESVEDIYVTSSVPRYIEVSHGDVCKRNAIRWLADFLNVPTEEIAAFGDGENDIEMIEYAGYGVAMENGVDVLKDIADRVAPSVDEDGVARVLKEFF